MIFSRIWAMPSKHTFTIKPIKDLLTEEWVTGIWVDPFCGEYSPANCTNDLNADIKAQSHMDALDYLRQFPDGYAGGMLFDPPYSVRQLSEVDKSVGIAVTQETTRPNFWTDIKKEIARVIKNGGKVISFGWNSGGIGKTLGFEITRILLVPHGGIHNDTIVKVEVKTQPHLL
ncbi:adenine-specific DNA methylase [Candidatus Pacearchaeota archaeon]|nr:adenine-specific DNA methylase [Candidatus Pacearchaeota archaeon]